MTKKIEIDYISKADLISVIIGEFVLWMESDDYLKQLDEYNLHNIYNDASGFFNAICNDLSIIEIEGSAMDLRIKAFLLQYFTNFQFVNNMYKQIVNKINLVGI